jgi:hypothetical protein
MKNRNNRNRHKINGEVRFTQVRLVGFYDEPKLMSSYEASKLAETEELDLILINENQNPPIVRLDDYKKFLYNLEKVEKERPLIVEYLNCSVPENIPTSEQLSSCQWNLKFYLFFHFMVFTCRVLIYQLGFWQLIMAYKSKDKEFLLKSDNSCVNSSLSDMLRIEL